MIENMSGSRPGTQSWAFDVSIKLGEVIDSHNALHRLYIELKEGLHSESVPGNSANSKEPIQYDGSTIQKDGESIQYPFETRVGMLRQWLNEDRITDSSRMVTNEQIMVWLKKEDVTPEPSQQVQNVTQGGSVCNPKKEEQSPPQEPYFVGGKVQKLVSDNIDELFEDAPPEKEEETPYEELTRVLSNKEKKRVVKAYKKKVLDALYEQKLKETGQVRKTAFVDAFNIVDWID